MGVRGPECGGDCLQVVDGLHSKTEGVAVAISGVLSGRYSYTFRILCFLSITGYRAIPPAPLGGIAKLC